MSLPRTRREFLRNAALAGLGAVCAAADPAGAQTPTTSGERADAQASPTGRAQTARERTRAASLRKPGWDLTFHDEFNGSKLDTTKWIDSYPDGVRTHSNNEQQYYATDGYSVGGGLLRLKGEKRSMGGMPYTSGMISSYGKFTQQFGWFEIRARFPKGKGYWPAFWLLPADKSWPPEIDVLEILGHETNKVYMTNHWRDANRQHKSRGGSFVGPDFAAGFHTFAAEWKPGEILWYVDGVQRFRSTEGVPAEPMYLLANLAIGGDWPGMPDETTVFPRTMDIDYIRVYKRASGR